ncbi:MAG: hypothetical protein WA003_15660 [Desulfuromonadaceae bacterium]
MSKYRRAAKIDTNQPGIVAALVARGVTVQVGHDDILVGHAGKTFWYEIKSPEAVSKKTGEVRGSALKQSQKDLLASWRGHYRVVSTVEEIIVDIWGEIL